MSQRSIRQTYTYHIFCRSPYANPIFVHKKKITTIYLSRGGGETLRTIAATTPLEASVLRTSPSYLQKSQNVRPSTIYKTSIRWGVQNCRVRMSSSLSYSVFTKLKLKTPKFPNTSSNHYKLDLIRTTVGTHN